MTTLPDEHVQQQLLCLAETVKDDYGRMDLSSMWRPYGRYTYVQSTTSSAKDPACSRSKKCHENLLLAHKLGDWCLHQDWHETKTTTMLL